MVAAGLLPSTVPISLLFSCLFIESFGTAAVDGAEIRVVVVVVDDVVDDVACEFFSWECEDWCFSGFGCCGCVFPVNPTRLSVDLEVGECDVDVDVDDDGGIDFDDVDDDGGIDFDDDDVE